MSFPLENAYAQWRKTSPYTLDLFSRKIVLSFLNIDAINCIVCILQSQTKFLQIARVACDALYLILLKMAAPTKTKITMKVS